MRQRGYFVGILVAIIIVALLVWAWLSISFWPLIAATVVAYAAFFSHDNARAQNARKNRRH